jgi:ribosomal 50S subunit-recycling heat shock protein
LPDCALLGPRLDWGHDGVLRPATSVGKMGDGQMREEMKPSICRTFASAVVLLLTVQTAMAADSSTAPSGKRERTLSAQATVEAVDLDKRTVVLKKQDGTTLIVQADERVKNLPQVKVGDLVQVTYRQALAYRVMEPGEAAPSAAEKGGITTAKPGEKPAGTATREVTVVATIEAIDQKNATVKLRGPDGNVTEVAARDPRNLAKVKVGDQVEVTYTEALAVAVVERGPAAGSSTPHAKKPSARDLNRQELERIQSAR